MPVGFTGTRDGLTTQQQAALEVALLQEVGPSGEVHHGDCIGADATLHALARKYRYRVIIHPPDVDALRAFCDGDQVLAAYPHPERNRRIVNATDILIACPNGPEQKRSGTWSTIRYARRTGKHVVIVWPDGTVTREWA